MKKISIFILIILALVLFAVSKDLNKKEYPDFSRAYIGNTTLSLLIADTDNERIKGLSGLESIEDNQAMLFIFSREGIYSFWMKDMNFPIDIIWINKDFKIVSIKENATPESYPEVFYPEAKALYVIETNVGIVAKEGIKIGEAIEIF